LTLCYNNFEKTLSLNLSKYDNKNSWYEKSRYIGKFAKNESKSIVWNKEKLIKLLLEEQKSKITK